MVMKNNKNLFVILLSLFFVRTASAQESTYLIHKAVDTSINGAFTTIDHEHMNKKVFLYPLVTHNFNPGGGAGIYQTSPVTIGREGDFWLLGNDDATPFKKNTNWNIFLPGPDFNSWAHITTVDNVNSHATLIDHPDLNNNPNALIFISKMYSPDGGDGKMNNKTVGVFYSELYDQWAIFNQSAQAMEVGVTFSVVFDDGSKHTTYLHKSTVDNTDGHITQIDHPDCNGNPNAKVIITQNWGTNGKFNNHEVGVYYNGVRWAIYNEDKADLTVGAAFNVLIVKEELASTNNDDLMNIPSLRIAPNPAIAGDHIQIDLYNESDEALQLEVMDMTGKVIVKSEIGGNNKVIIHKLSTAGFEPGMYMIRVYNTRVAAVRRLIID